VNRERGALEQNLLDVLGVGNTANEVLITGSSLPKHDTTELLGVSLHVSLDHLLGLVNGKVEASVSSGSGGRKTQVELGVWVGTVADDIDPVVEVEAGGAVHPVGGGTVGGVVPLHPEEIEDRVRDGVAELGIGDDALGGTGDVEGLVRDLVVVPAETINQGSPADAAITLDIEIEAVDGDGLEGTGEGSGKQGFGP
jgi:hypothetical protein